MYKTIIISLAFSLALTACSKSQSDEKDTLKHPQSEVEKIDLKSAVRLDNERELRERAAKKAEATTKSEAARETRKP